MKTLNTTHTAGHWRTDGLRRESATKPRHFTVTGPDGELIAECYFGKTDAECAANARLCASAPELLFALSQIIADLPAKRDWLDPDLERIAKEAILKSTGGAK